MIFMKNSNYNRIKNNNTNNKFCYYNKRLISNKSCQNLAKHK